MLKKKFKKRGSDVGNNLSGSSLKGFFSNILSSIGHVVEN